MTSNQVDRINGLVGSIAVKAPCKVATTENITLSGSQTVDGVALTADETPRQRVLVKEQTDTTENGIYDVNSGAWTRSPDFDGARDAVDGTQVLVVEGTVGGNTMFVLSVTDPVDIGTDSITFDILTEVIGSAGTAALKDHGTAAGEVPLNSDLGTVAIKDHGTAAGEVPLNSDLGTAAIKDTGSSIGNVVELEDVGSSPGLPAVTGEQLTDLDATQIGNGTVSNTEFQYIGTLQSNAQTQIDAKLDSSVNSGVAKAWIRFDGTGTISIAGSYNVTSITDHGVGDYTITWDTDFDSTHYAVSAMSNQAGSYNTAISFTSKSAGALRIRVAECSTNTAADVNIIGLIAMGDQ